jgi:hypothetical protein
VDVAPATISESRDALDRLKHVMQIVVTGDTDQNRNVRIADNTATEVDSRLVALDG